jgi:APA family basic amino acid/polyamine antiporter
VLRFTQPDLERPFRLPSVGKVPVTAVLGILSSLVLAAQYEWMVYLAFAAAFMLGALPYLIMRRNPSRR